MANEWTQEQKTAYAIELLKDALQDLESGSAHAEGFGVSAETAVNGVDGGYLTRKYTGRRTYTIITQQTKNKEEPDCPTSSFSPA